MAHLVQYMPGHCVSRRDSDDQYLRQRVVGTVKQASRLPPSSPERAGLSQLHEPFTLINGKDVSDVLFHAPFDAPASDTPLSSPVDDDERDMQNCILQGLFTDNSGLRPDFNQETLSTQVLTARDIYFVIGPDMSIDDIHLMLALARCLVAYPNKKETPSDLDYPSKPQEAALELLRETCLTMEGVAPVLLDQISMYIPLVYANLVQRELETCVPLNESMQSINSAEMVKSTSTYLNTEPPSDIVPVTKGSEDRMYLQAEF